MGMAALVLNLDGTAESQGQQRYELSKHRVTSFYIDSPDIKPNCGSSSLSKL